MSTMHRPDPSPLSRRRFLAVGAGAFVVGVVPFAWRGPLRRVRRTVPIMGTVGEIAVVHEDRQLALRAIDAAIVELRGVEDRMTRFRATSDIGRANLEAATRRVSITAETASVLQEAIRWSEGTGGLFNPCLGKAMASWNFADQARSDAPRSPVLQPVGVVADLDVRVDGSEASVRYGSADIALDLGGIAKGYGVDRAAAAIRAAGIDKALVNVGGDLWAIGSAEDGSPWTIGIRDPKRPNTIAEQLEITDRAVATSGDYLQQFVHEGHRYHHLLDGRTGTPRETHTHSTTVIADSCTTADAAATAVFGLQRPVAERVLRSLAPGARLIAIA